jgi:membrane protein implicated in regulation of membrane protease activity
METVMTASKQGNRQAGLILTLLGCLLLLLAPFVVAQDDTSQGAKNEPLFIQGVVKRVSLEKRAITLKPSRQERIKITVDDQTGFIQMSTLEELQKGQRIKVWYTVDGNKNRVVKVERLPDLGC